MKIEKITITKKELCTAVRDYLYNVHKMDLEVTSVENDYSSPSNFRVGIKEEEETEIAPNISTTP